MNFDDIRKDKNQFYAFYGLERNSPVSWDALLAIGEDYERKQKSAYPRLIAKAVKVISAFEGVHSVRWRIKKTSSLLAKIVRKNLNDVTASNYHQHITDLLGIRVLYVFKKDYLIVHKQIMDNYRGRLCEDIKLKLKEGDDDQLYADLPESHVKKETGEYRSIHYIINSTESKISENPKLEIQTRSIFEEGWSEINHKLVYKKDRMDNTELRPLSKILSNLVGDCDSIALIMKKIYDAQEKESANNDKDSVNSVLRQLFNADYL